MICNNLCAVPYHAVIEVARRARTSPVLRIAFTVLALIAGLFAAYHYGLYKGLEVLAGAYLISSVRDLWRQCQSPLYRLENLFDDPSCQWSQHATQIDASTLDFTTFNFNERPFIRGTTTNNEPFFAFKVYVLNTLTTGKQIRYPLVIFIYESSYYADAHGKEWKIWEIRERLIENSLPPLDDSKLKLYEELGRDKTGCATIGSHVYSFSPL